MSAPETGEPELGVAKAIVRWVDNNNAGALGYQPDARYPLGRWVLERGDDWSVDLNGGPGDTTAAFRDAEQHLRIPAGSGWEEMLNGWGDAYTVEVPASPVQTQRQGPRPVGATTTSYMCGVIAIFFFPPVLGIAGIIFGAIAVGRGERGAGWAIAFCIATMLFGMAYGYHTMTGYWPWQTVYYYRY